MSTIDVAGYSAFVTESGEGAETILLVPTMFGRADTYKETIAELARRGFRVITIELPGTGYSSKLTEPWSCERLSVWLAGAIDTMRLDPTHLTLVGHSNSAAVVMFLAARRPGLCARIVLADTVGAMPHPRLPAILMGRALDSILELRLTIWGSPHLLFNLRRHTLNLLYQLELAVERPAWALPRIAVPTLLAWGARDHTIPLRASRRALERLIQAPQLYISRLGSHDWCITEPTEFADAVNAFIRTSRGVEQ
jgi:pimeloyl-ACP methyl ester carboxylesterase